MKRKYKYLFIVTFVLILITSVLFWYLRPYEPMDRAEKVFDNTHQSISVIDKNWLVFKPRNNEINTGVIIYPGARVKPRSYRPLALEIAKSGSLVVIVPMPLNLAVLGINKADKVIKKYSKVKNWVIGGHSLGGAMASRYTYYNTNKVSGLVLMASYPSENNDLSNKKIRTLSIYGTKDGITDIKKIKKSKEILPKNTTWIKIKGGNHSQFGWYGFQDGDKKASISRRKQQNIIVNDIINFLSTFD